MPDLRAATGHARIGGKVLSGTSGSVLFVDASGNLAQDNTNFKWIDASDRLEVPEVRAVGAAGLKLYEDGGAGIFIKDGGNVGVGTTAPDDLLHVRGNGAATPRSIVLDPGGIYAGYQVKLTTTPADEGFNLSVGGTNIISTYGYYDADEIGIGVKDYENELYINTNGFIGIGTTAPDKKLEINTGAADNGLRISYNDADGSATNYSELITGADGDLTITTVDSDGAAGHIALMPDGNVGIGTVNPSWKLDVVGTDARMRVFDTTNGGVLLGYSGATIQGRTSADANGKLAINPYGGNVGIGTTAPQNTLQVGAGTDAAFQGYAGIMANGTTHAQISARNSDTDVEVGMFAYTNTGYMGTWTNHPLILRTNNANVMALLASGNVGIGTTTPGALLHVYGASYPGAIFTNTLASGFGYNQFSSAGAGTSYQYWFGNTYSSATNRYVASSFLLDAATSGGLGLAASNASGAIRLYTGGDNERMRIDNQGNVGIGTTAPDKKLEINTGATENGIRLAFNDSNGSASDYLDILTKANGETTITTVDSDGAVGHLNLSPDGNVVVTSPLQVNSTATIGLAGTATGQLKISGTTSGTAIITVPAVAGTPTYVLPAAVGAAGTFLKDAAGDGVLSWAAPAGGGDVTKVGTPVDNQVGVWTGDGTIEGTSGLTYDGSNLLLTGDIGATGTRITKGWFTDLEVTNGITGAVTEALAISYAVAL